MYQLPGDDTARPFTARYPTVTSENTRFWTNADLMLCQRRRRWPNIKPALVQHLADVRDADNYRAAQIVLRDIVIDQGQ